MTFRQFLCGLRGHDRVFRFENRPHGLPPRVLLHCTDCEHDTPGLEPAPTRPVQKFAGDPRRHQLPSRNVLRLARKKSA